MPPNVTAASGFDVLCHSIESYTALPFNRLKPFFFSNYFLFLLSPKERKPRPSKPILRPTYQGSNPISDIWALKALEMTAKWLPIAFAEPDNKEARYNMTLASTYAGYKFPTS